jgi:hypothetical protein
MNDEYSYPYIKEEGSLYIQTSNRAGRKFQTWNFKPVNGDVIVIEVDLLYPSKDKPLRFSAKSTHLTQSYESSDIEELRRLVDTDLQKSCYLFNKIVWEEWYRVIVGAGYKNGPNESSMTISYGKLKRGIHPETGEALTIHQNKVVLPFPTPKNSCDDTGWCSNYAKDDEVSFIPVTERNTMALESLVMKLSNLREEVANFLSQDMIEQTILTSTKIEPTQICSF